jgi:putative transposase
MQKELPVSRLSSCSLTPGTLLWWDGKPWRTLNLSETAITLLSPEKHLVDLPLEVLDDLLRQRKVTVATPLPGDALHTEEQELLQNASPEQLEIAAYRYKLLRRALPEETVISKRTLQRWRTRFRTAEANYGHGFIGLIPQRNRQGNRQPRLSQSVEQLLEKYMTEYYEAGKQQSKRSVYLLLEREAMESGLPAPSYRTFLDRIQKRDQSQPNKQPQGPAHFK